VNAYGLIHIIFNEENMYEEMNQLRLLLTLIHGASLQRPTSQPVVRAFSTFRKGPGFLPRSSRELAASGYAHCMMDLPELLKDK
jgi:hypothetical protein